MKFLILLFIVFSTQTYAKDLLLESCIKRSGSVVRGHLCPKSKIPIPARACFYKNSHNETQFYNGCSGPTGGYKEIFYSSCIQHDLCYHNEPASNGFSQKTCDMNFLNGMEKACDLKDENKVHCLKWARNLYRALRIIGKPAYHCANNLSDYLTTSEERE